MDRYLLGQIGSAKNSMFHRETTLSLGTHQ